MNLFIQGYYKPESRVYEYINNLILPLATISGILYCMRLKALNLPVKLYENWDEKNKTLCNTREYFSSLVTKSYIGERHIAWNVEMGMNEYILPNMWYHCMFFFLIPIIMEKKIIKLIF